MSITRYLQDLKHVGLLREIPNISEENALFLREIIRTKKVRNILEIGTANGYSTLQFASAFETDDDIPEITTIEWAWNAHNEAVTHFRDCKMKNITAIWGDAKKVIPTLADVYFDFCFIDAKKSEYLDYLLLVIPKLTENATIIIDDVVKFRPKMENLFTFLEAEKIPYEITQTDPDDGIMIIEKRRIP